MSDTSLKGYVATSDLHAHQKTLSGPAWLADLRAAAAAKFDASDWPSTSEEEWRRTSLRAFEFDSYRAGGENTPAAHTPADASPLAGKLVFQNDTLTSASVNAELAGRGVVFGSLTDIVESAAGDNAAPAISRSRETLQRSLDLSDNRFQYWHYALLADAAVLYVPRLVEIGEPFTVDFHLTGDEVIRTPHLLVFLEEGARATVIKRLISQAEGEVLAVDADDLVVGDAAGLRFVTVQRLNDESLVFSNSRGHVGRDGQLHRTEAALGADFVKTRFVSELAGTGADAELNGLYLPIEEQHMDLRTVQSHAAPRTASRAFYRGAVRGASHAIYQGLITVNAEAVGTDAYLTNKNLILSEDARADSIPSLNISTDEVKCSHGSTTGKLDESQLFYLRTRGYTESEARLTLIEGYFENLIAQTPLMIQDELRDLISGRLADAGDE